MQNVQQIIGIIGVLVTCGIAVGGVLIFIGRALGTLDSMTKAVNVALQKTDKHDEDIARIDKEVTMVKTRQEDCSNCNVAKGR